MSQEDELDYQDPILTPGNLRKIVQNLPGKIKHQHTDYVYNCDSDTFENEINEFFKYTEVTVQLQEYRRAYGKEYKLDDWNTSKVNKTDDNRQHIISLMDKLENTDQEIRLQTCKHLLYVSLGHFTTAKNELKQQRIDNLFYNNNLLFDCGAFTIFYQKLQQHNNVVFVNSQQIPIGICTEIDLYLTLIYLLLEIQRFPSKSSEKFKHELVTLEPNLTEFLFSLMTKLREKLDKSFPIKKTVLLLWKSLLFMSGGQESIKSLATRTKESLGLPTKNKDIIAKSTPQDLAHFQNEVTDKYPGYLPPDFLFPISSPLTINTSPSLATAMGYSNATNNVELLYQTLFPPKSSSSTNGTNGISNGSSSKKQNQLQNYFLYPPHVSPAVVLPLAHTGSDVPESIREAGDVYISNMHLSLANYQIMKERSNRIHKWQQQERSSVCDNNQANQQDEKMYLIEQIYAKVIPNLQNIIVVLLKLLLTAVTTSSNSRNNNEDDDDDDNSKGSFEKEDNITLEYIEEVDVIRNREVYSKAISGILIILLKWTKSSHVLKFEYLSQLLADSGCLLLILKIIGLQEITELVKARTDIPYYSFFDYNVDREADSVIKEEIRNTKNKSYTNRRNMYWTINYLRILQMLTKHKTHRTMLLVQYKSSAILKRILKISHPVLELYILKLLKSQVPYLGRKWRSQNMKIISAVYLNCHTVLRDDGISKINSEADIEEGKMQETNLRILTRIYNGKRYMPSLLPLHDEINATNGSIPSGPGLNGFSRYDMDVLRDDYMDAVDLEPQFFENYEKWLEAEVFNSTDDEGDDRECTSVVNATANGQVDTPAPPTPYPLVDDNTKTNIYYDQLTYEINKLYIEQMNAEFRPTPPLSIAPSLPTAAVNKDVWESPPAPKKITPLARYRGDENNLTYIGPNITKSQSRSSINSSNDNENRDPVELQMQIKDELVSRLIQVEDKTIEQWIGNNNNERNLSQYHFNILDDLYDDELYYATTGTNNSNESGKDDKYGGNYLIREEEEEEEDEEEEEYNIELLCIYSLHKIKKKLFA